MLKTTFGYSPKDVLKRLSCEQIRALLEGYNSYRSVGKSDEAGSTGETDWDDIEDVSDDEQLELMKAMGLTDGG